MKRLIGIGIIILLLCIGMMSLLYEGYVIEIVAKTSRVSEATLMGGNFWELGNFTRFIVSSSLIFLVLIDYILYKQNKYSSIYTHTTFLVIALLLILLTITLATQFTQTMRMFDIIDNGIIVINIVYGVVVFMMIITKKMTEK